MSNHEEQEQDLHWSEVRVGDLVNYDGEWRIVDRISKRSVLSDDWPTFHMEGLQLSFPSYRYGPFRVRRSIGRRLLNDMSGEEAVGGILAWLRAELKVTEEICHRGCGSFPPGTKTCPFVDETGEVCGKGLLECHEDFPGTREELAIAIERGDPWNRSKA
jgi:hypothetical protein